MEFIDRKTAKELGIKRYKTGRPCPKGHIGDRFVSSGGCCSCLKAQPPIPTVRSCEVCGVPMQVTITARQKRCSIKCRQIGAARQFRAENADSYRMHRNNYRKSQKGRTKLCELSARRRAALVNAIVGWTDHQRIHNLYERCRAMCGERQYHVDHIVPLMSDLVCGLHVVENLQIILGVENQAKGNRFNAELGNMDISAIKRLFAAMRF